MVRIHSFKKDMFYKTKAPNTTPLHGVYNVQRAPPSARPIGQSSRLRGSKLVPSKCRSLVPPMLRNTPKGHTHRVLRKRKPLDAQARTGKEIIRCSLFG